MISSYAEGGVQLRKHAFMLAKFAMVSYIDCYENEDEQECSTTCLSSCNKWFKRGYTTSGEYCIGKFSH